METRVSLEVEGVTVGDVILDASESAGAEECASCPELGLAPWVAAAFLEG